MYDIKECFPFNFDQLDSDELKTIRVAQESAAALCAHFDDVPQCRHIERAKEKLEESMFLYLKAYILTTKNMGKKDEQA